MKINKLILLATVSLGVVLGFQNTQTRASLVPLPHDIQDHNKILHGYKVGSKYNTKYIKESHVILSKYRPTNKTKVIFQKGLNVIPNRHVWIKRVVTKNNVKIYSYRFEGKWKLKDTNKISKADQKKNLYVAGYKVDNTGYKYNTYYDKGSGITSNYAPTSKDKIVFKYGTKIDPTKFKWEKRNYISGTYYKFINNTWRTTGMWEA